VPGPVPIPPDPLPRFEEAAGPPLGSLTRLRFEGCATPCPGAGVAACCRETSPGPPPSNPPAWGHVLKVTTPTRITKITTPLAISTPLAPMAAT
jgi:hypothetical protein